MKYMLLMQGTQTDMKAFGTLPTEDIKAHIEFMLRLNRDLKASGEMVDAQGLMGPEQAQVVRAVSGGGAPAVTDGPFPEAKEFLAGYWLLECSGERAIEIAARVSSAPGRGGVPLNFPVQVRQVGSPPDL
jgi:hypothetical protein